MMVTATTTDAVPIETAHEDMIHDAQLDYHGRRLATYSSNRTVKVFKVFDGEPSKSGGQTLKGHTGPGLPRSYIATASQSVLIWTKDTPATLKTPLDPSLTTSQNAPTTPGKFPDVVWCVSWSLAGNILAVSCWDGKVTLWKENLECVSDVNS